MPIKAVFAEINPSSPFNHQPEEPEMPVSDPDPVARSDEDNPFILPSFETLDAKRDASVIDIEPLPMIDPAPAPTTTEAPPAAPPASQETDTD